MMVFDKINPPTNVYSCLRITQLKEKEDCVQCNKRTAWKRGGMGSEKFP